MDIEVTESGTAAHPVPRERVGRRGLLAAGVGGAALSLLPFLSGRAGASATTDGSTTSTTTPPLRPTDDDVALLSFAQQVELTALALYDKAIATGGWSDAQATVMVNLREAHQAYGNALSGFLGRKAPGAPDEQLFNQLKGDFAGSVADMLDAAYALESAAVATHLDVLAKLQGTDGASLIASILVNEARHGTVLADLNGKTDDADLLVDKEADSLVGNG